MHTTFMDGKPITFCRAPKPKSPLVSIFLLRGYGCTSLSSRGLFSPLIGQSAFLVMSAMLRRSTIMGRGSLFNLIYEPLLLLISRSHCYRVASSHLKIIVLYGFTFVMRVYSSFAKNAALWSQHGSV